MPQVSAALVRSAPSKTIASANIRRDAALSFSRPAAARSPMAVKSLRVTAIAAIVLAPHHTKSSSIQTFSDSGTPTSHPFSPLVLYLPLQGGGIGGLRPPFFPLKNADAEHRLWREAPGGGEHQGNPTPTATDLEFTRDRHIRFRKSAIADLRGGRPSPFRGGISHAPIVALTILSGSLTGSPRLILSTLSIPSITLPQAVYWLSRKRASSKQMKNWLSPESGLPARAIDTVPRTCGSLLNSALSFCPEPPVPLPCGQPVCAMKPSITRWNTMPS